MARILIVYGSDEGQTAKVAEHMAAGGGYILGPCHNMQAVNPVENIVAMYETGYEHGWY